jgi:cell division septation protein DedD
LKRAKKAIAVYSKKGLHPYWTKVYLKEKGCWYRIFAGYFADRQQAENLREQSGLAEATIEKTKYANLIGVYESSDEFRDVVQSLKNLGYFPYIVNNPSGKSQVLVGAFFTRAGAHRQYRQLESNGVRNQVVRR